MPDFEVTSPEGQKFKVTAPEGATQDQILAYAKANIPKAAPAKLSMTVTAPAPADLPAPGSTPQEAQARQSGGPVDPNTRWRDLARGAHDAPAYQPKTQTLPGGRQELYDMATNDVERFKILSKFYGKDNIGRDAQGLYIKQPGGRQVYPKSSLVSGTAANAAPIAGQIAGALGGAAAGTAASPAGAIPGAVAGAAAGGAVGQGVNDLILKHFDFYDRTMGQEAGVLGAAAAEGAVSEAGGRVLGAAARFAGTAALTGGLKATGATALGDRGPLRALVGFDPAAAALAKDLARQGYNLNPTSYAPAMKRLAREFELARLYGADPTAKSEAKYAKDKVLGSLEKLGMSKDTAATEYERMRTLTEASSVPAGQALKGAAAGEVERGGANLANIRGNMAAEAESAGKAAVAARDASVKALQTRAAALQTMVQKTLDQGKRLLDVVAQRVKPGPLAEDYAKKLFAYKENIQNTATQLYAAADEMAGGATHDFSGAALAAQQFAADIPRELRGVMEPSLIKRIEDLGQIGDGETGKAELTFGQAHQLRSQLRNLSYSDKLTPNFKIGPYLHLSGVVDDIIHQGEAGAQWKDAVKQLDTADKFYADNMRQFSNSTLQKLATDARDGLPVDAVKLARTIGTPGEMATFDRILKIGGEPLRKRVAAADLRDVLTYSARLGRPDKIDPKELLKALTERKNNKTLARIYGPDSLGMMRYAKRLAARGGDIPIPAFEPRGIMERDGFMRALATADRIQGQITELAARKPLELMAAAAKPINERMAQLEKEFGGRLSADQLRFLRDPEVLAEAAAKRVLRSEELLTQAAERFPEAMPLLRQHALESMLSPLARNEGSGELSAGLKALTEKQQKILFPGGTDEDLRRLVESLQVIRGPATRSMPGFAAGATLGASPIGPEGLTAAGKRQLLATYVTKLAATPMFNKLFIHLLTADLEEGPAGVARATHKLQSLLSVAGRIPARAAGRMGGFEENEGTPEGQATLPEPSTSQDNVPDWRKAAQ